jgi:hypothetical protein
MKLSAALSLAFVVLALSPATAALAQPGPSLADTLGFIQGKLLARGDLSWVVTRSDASGGEPHLDRVNRVQTDAAACALTINYTVLIQGQQQSYDDTIQFGKISDVQLATWAHLATSTSVTFQTQPEVWTVELFFPNTTAAINFFDQSMADRVAKAVSHAAQLCGGLKSAQ